jgi:energy-converting hydrogenase Eha subunit F
MGGDTYLPRIFLFSLVLLIFFLLYLLHSLRARFVFSRALLFSTCMSECFCLDTNGVVLKLPGHAPRYSQVNHVQIRVKITATTSGDDFFYYRFSTRGVTEPTKL